MRLKRSAIGVIGFTILSLSLLSSCHRSEKTGPLSKVTIALFSGPYPGLIYLADGLGYFRDEGVDVKLSVFPDGKNAFAEVLAKRADLATLYETPIAYETLHGQRLAILTTLHESTLTSAVIGRKDRGINRVVDLQGKRIGITPETHSESFLYVLLIEAGLAISDVKTIDIRSEKMVEALKTGQVDAISSWHPHTTHAAQALGSNRVTTFHSDVYTDLLVLACLQDYVASHGKSLSAIVRAVMRAESFLKSNETDALTMINNYLKGQELTKDDPLWKTSSFRTGLTNHLLAVLKLETQWLMERGLYKGAIPEYRDILEPAYLLDAHSNAVTTITDETSNP